ncbi:ABC transporter substrate-binding protein [Maridesulfovibrio ferrireducens]|uniref:ABC transporter substrate-binding protein n=1 Tax=Maridesulfovibrio ferrireducens TaxID=246191 RepID=UPI001A23F197|nr:ABC transporter substrate-binding protein [Maridesulfovibrio ferrireducens]MBI9111950.1 ABC transporter substrate-binding protein [Maridesulfovibrio ferrireducens]
MRKLLSYFLVLILTATVVLLPGCSQTPPPVQAKPLRVGWFLWPGWYPIVIAKEKGFFDKHGVQVEPILYTSYTDIFSDFAAAKIDAAHGGLYELLKINVPNMKVVLATDNSDGAEGVVVTSDIVTPGDLAGKRIGIQGALSGSEFIITTLLRRHGLSRNDLILVDVGPEIVLDTMPEQIQGGYTWEPYLSKAEAKGYKVLFTTADTPGMVPDVIVFQGAVAKKRHPEVQAFVDAWFEAQEYWMANREECDAIIAKATGQRAEDISIEGCRILSRSDNQKAFIKEDERTSLFDTGAKQVDFFISVGDVFTAPDLNKILDPSYVQGMGADVK